MTKPNLFKHASSELSQDAMLSWLLEWANADAAPHDPSLHQLGVAFLEHLYRLARLGDIPTQPRLTIRRQLQGADVVAEVHDGPILLVEDKTFTREHSNQLARYRTAIESIYPDRPLACFYLTIGEQADYDGVRNAEYHIVNRSMLLGIFDTPPGSKIDNAIVVDFRENLRALDDDFASYKTRTLDSWSGTAEGWYPWQGFFVEIQRRFPETYWSYVPNQAGGFWGLWWEGYPIDGRQVYVQLENDSFCFKIKVPPGADRTADRNTWSGHLMKCDATANLGIVKPKRFGTGIHMTCAILRAGYRRATPSGVLELEATVGVINDCLALLAQAKASFEGWPSQA